VYDLQRVYDVHEVYSANDFSIASATGYLATAVINRADRNRRLAIRFWRVVQALDTCELASDGTVVSLGLVN
jgi:hypothetical protein